MARETPKPTTSWPLNRARPRGSDHSSVTSPRSPRRTLRSPMGIRVSRSCSTDWAEPTVRMACSSPAISPRPPGRLMLEARSWFDTWAAVTPEAARSAGSSLMRISRLTPPSRLIWLTPRTDNRRLATVLSTNQLSSSGLMPGARTTKLAKGMAVNSIRWTIGS